MRRMATSACIWASPNSTRICAGPHLRQRRDRLQLSAGALLRTSSARSELPQHGKIVSPAAREAHGLNLSLVGNLPVTNVHRLRKDRHHVCWTTRPPTARACEPAPRRASFELRHRVGLPPDRQFEVTAEYSVIASISHRGTRRWADVGRVALPVFRYGAPVRQLTHPRAVTATRSTFPARVTTSQSYRFTVGSQCPGISLTTSPGAGLVVPASISKVPCSCCLFVDHARPSATTACRCPPPAPEAGIDDRRPGETLLTTPASTNSSGGTAGLGGCAPRVPAGPLVAVVVRVHET